MTVEDRYSITPLSRALFFSILLLIIILTSGCITPQAPQSSHAVTDPPAQEPVTATTTAAPMKASGQDYVRVRETVKPETRPARTAFGFTMDSPTGWNITREHSDDWNAVVVFTSPDGESFARVYMADERGSASHLDPLDTWSDATIRAMTRTYCHDGNGRPGECTAGDPGSSYHRPVLLTSEAVVVKGSTGARRMVFVSPEDPAFGWKTVYLIYAGTMRAYNYTAPGHYEVAVRVTGPGWDYAMGGLRYKILLFTPENQVNATTPLFRRMMDSFRIDT